jgi:hypothetical protein
MINITNLVYGAGKNGGLSAPVLIQFTELNCTVFLNASFQGDPVKARTIQVDNYNGSLSLTYTVGNQSSIIPAYSIGYIDVSYVDSIEFEAQTNQNLQLYILSNQVAEGFETRGAIPSGLANDPYYNKVDGLWHCEGIAGSNILQNIKNPANNGTFAIAANSNFNSTIKRFGSTSLETVSPPSVQIFNCNLPKTMGAGDFTLEFSMYLTGAIPSYDRRIFRLGGQDSSTLNNVRLNSSLQIIGNIGNGNNFTYSVTPPTLSIGQWYDLAFVSISGKGILFIDGIGYALGTIGDFTALGNIIYIQESYLGTTNGLIFYDEIRLSSFARYVANYTPLGREFFEY